MKFIIQIFTGILLLTMPFNVSASEIQTDQEQSTGEQSFASQQDGGGSIWEYKENYVPKKFNPLPEFMIYIDLAVLLLLLSAALYFVIKKKGSQKIQLLVILSLIYLGLLRGGCICPVGAIANITIGIVHPAMIGLATMAVFIIPLIFALIAGRVYCTSGCPIGAIQHLLYKKKKHYKLPSKIDSALKIIPVAILIAAVYLALTSRYYLICELEPYKALFFTGKTWFGKILSFFLGNSVEAKFLWTFGFFTWGYLLAMLAIGFWIPRPFCRFMCPYGVLLGFVSLFAFKPRKIDKDICIHCGQCQKVCPTQSITIDRKNKLSSLSRYSCVQCNRCSDVCKAKAIK